MSAKAPIRALVDRNLDRADTLPIRLAMLAPDAAVTKLKAGKQVGLSSYGHFHWRMGAAVVAQLAEAHRDLLGPMIAPHAKTASEQLSRTSQPFFDEPLLFLRLIWQLAPDAFEQILAGVHAAGAEAGWAAALSGGDAKLHAPTGDRTQRRVDRETAAWLVERTLGRGDDLGAAARRLRERFPKRSLPTRKSLEPFT